MAPLESVSSEIFFNSNVMDNTFDIYECNSMEDTKAVADHSRYSRPPCTNGPDPPPPPGTLYGKQRTYRNAKACSIHVSEEVQDYWNKLFSEGYQADVCVSTDDGSNILSHSCILLRHQISCSKNYAGRSQSTTWIQTYILISGVPSEAAHVFIRYLYSSRLCDTPRLSLFCTRMIIGDFKSISLSEGWKVMRQVNPSLEQELLGSLVEVDTRRRM
uniref:Uncharacterized protein n=1 Tax=Avena sativa TaxID=4498 RepID=A0ACD5WHT9_AVESA